MPIYEYGCEICNHHFEHLLLRTGDVEPATCPHCEEDQLHRMISRVAYHVSEQARLDAYEPNNQKGESYCRDSRNIGLHVKKRAQQMGVCLGDNFEAKLDKLRTDPGSVF